MNVEIIVTRVFIGPIIKNEDHSYKTENHLVKTRRPSKEWDLFLMHGKNIYSKIELVEVLKEDIAFGTKKVKGKEVPTQKHSYETIDSSEAIKKEVWDIFKVKTVLTEDQKRIATLEAQIAALSGGGKAEKTVKEPVAKKEEKKEFDNTPNTNEELEAARNKYMEVFKLEKAPKGFHLRKLKTLNEEIEAELNK